VRESHPRQRSRATASIVVTAIAGLAALPACGGAAPPASPHAPATTTPAEDEREPTSIAEAEARVARAKAELEERVDHDALGDGAPAPGTRPASPAAAPPAPPASSPTRAADEAVSKAGRSLGVTTRCSEPCRALASMRRAVEALCRLTGGDDTRCVDAKRTLSESSARISPCAC